MNTIPTLLFLSSLFHFSLSNQFIYNNGFNETDLKLDGNAKIHANGLLQLTNTSKQKTGHAFHKSPVKFNRYDFSFSTSFVFAMVPELPKLGNQGHGHGMAFLVSPSTDFSQAVASQHLGLFNLATNNRSENQVLAIELDSVLSPEFQDINANHVGVDVNSLTSLDSASVRYFSSQDGINKSLDLSSGDPIQVWIEYSSENAKIEVTLAPVRVSKPDRPLLSTSLNLSRVFHTEEMYVGFSAATGSIASDHYILGWSFNRTGKAQSLEFLQLPKIPPRKKRSQKYGKVITGLSAVLGFFFIGLVSGAIYVAKNRKYREVREDWETVYAPQRLSYKTLYKATRGFRDKEVLGEGGFGKVYRGTLDSAEGKSIAVKKVWHGSDKGMEQFVAEVAVMGRLKHRNLVGLVGYCRRKGELLLVYDYMPNGSLDKYLFGHETPSLDWPRRVRIVRDVASGLVYLHEEWEQVVLHRDVKASNVLLDSEFNARLGDFGLARLCDHGSDPLTTRVVGTVGYLAPELSRTGKATKATDVFSFGVFVLEVVCGRRPLKAEGPPEEVLLADWVSECSARGSIIEACDPRLLVGDFPAEEIESMMRLGLACACSDPSHRPTMSQVIRYLEGGAANDGPQHQHGISLETCLARDGASDYATTFPLSPFNSFTSSNSILEVGRL